MNKRQIIKALTTAAFTPGKSGPLKVIADVGNINYYIRRAIEFTTLSLTALTREQRIKYFDNALGMIALAKVKTQEGEKIKLPPSRECSPIPENEYHPVEFPGIIHVAGKDDEVDKQDEDGEVHSKGDSIQPPNIRRDVCELEGGSKITGPISKETQSRPQTQAQKEEAAAWGSKYNID